MENLFKITIISFLLLLSLESKGSTRDLDFIFAGNNFIESNSPEVVHGPGYVFKHDTFSQERGVQDYPLTGCTDIYFFHINKSGENLNFHLMVKSRDTNKNNLTLLGSSYTNFEKYLGPYRGQSYSVAYDWIMKKQQHNKRLIIDTTYQSLMTKSFYMGSMIDGKFKICAEQPYYVALVVSRSQSTKTTIKDHLEESAPGIILPIRKDTYGRVAAIFEKSQILGNIKLESGFKIKSQKWHINTISKLDKDRHLQDQTMQCLINLSDSSCQSNGNYGREYKLKLEIKNNLEKCQRYKISFGSNYTNKVNKPSFTWNCPIRVGSKMIPTYTTPTNPTQLLTTIDVLQGEEIKIPIEFIPCGLITAKQNLEIEEMECIEEDVFLQLKKRSRAIQLFIRGSYHQKITEPEESLKDYNTYLLNELNLKRNCRQIKI